MRARLSTECVRVTAIEYGLCVFAFVFGIICGRDDATDE